MSGPGTTASRPRTPSVATRRGRRASRPRRGLKRHRGPPGVRPRHRPVLPALPLRDIGKPSKVPLHLDSTRRAVVGALTSIGTPTPANRSDATWPTAARRWPCLLSPTPTCAASSPPDSPRTAWTGPAAPRSAGAGARTGLPVRSAVSWTGADHAFTSVTGGEARLKDLHVTIAALLVARLRSDGFNVRDEVHHGPCRRSLQDPRRRTPQEPWPSDSPVWADLRTTTPPMDACNPRLRL